MLKNKKFILRILMGVLIFVSSVCAIIVYKAQSQPKGYPIDSQVFTTLQRTVVPGTIPANAEKIFPYEISKYTQNGYGVWHYGPGVAAVKRLDLMPAAYKSNGVTNAAKLLNFFTMTDVHITDEESPVQGIEVGYKGGNSSGYSPVMMYTTQVLDAAVQTVNALNKVNPFNFGVFLGDAINNNQFNELRWYIDTIDGKVIDPDSGIKNDPVPGPNNDYQDPFKAEGLDKSIPWYQVMGNHDQFYSGVYPVNDYLKQAYVGKDILNMGNLLTDPRGIDARGTYMGALDGSTPNGNVIGVGPVSSFKTPPQVDAADPNRRPLTKAQWMSEFFNTTSKPVGHGFTQANVDNSFACYSFEPKSDLPLKVIVLDDNQDSNNYDMHEQGYLDNTRYNWLVSQLDDGQKKGQLMIIAAHIPLYMMDLRGHAQITQKQLIDKLHTYPNLLMWLAGHYHQNTVTAYKSPDPNHPELGFWQVETSSLRDFPQEFRTFQILRNSDNTISIVTTDVDPAVKDGSLAASSRTFAVATEQLFKNKINYLPTGVYNAELVKQLTPEMQKKLQNYGTPIKK